MPDAGKFVTVGVIGNLIDVRECENVRLAVTCQAVVYLHYASVLQLFLFFLSIYRELNEQANAYKTV